MTDSLSQLAVRQRRINGAIVSPSLPLCSVLDLGHGTPLEQQNEALCFKDDEVPPLIVRRQQESGF